MNCKYCRANCTGAKQDREIAMCLSYDPPKTNADRIRNMTDEELADFICKTQFAFIPRSLGNIPISVYDGMSVLEWLKQEADT